MKMAKMVAAVVSGREKRDGREDGSVDVKQAAYGL